MVSNQFFNELFKRDLGRQLCVAQGCTHFMSMDTDEFYKVSFLSFLEYVFEQNLVRQTCAAQWHMHIMPMGADGFCFVGPLCCAQFTQRHELANI